MKLPFPYYITLTAVLSGIIVATLTNFIDLEDISIIIMMFGAGTIYGLLTVVPVCNEYNSKKVWTGIFWVIASTLSYALAVQATLLIAPTNLFPQPNPTDYALGGFVGALIMTLTYVLMTKWHHRHFSIPRIVATILFGTVLPLILFTLLSETMGTIVMYVTWPTIITATLFIQKSSNIVE